jgi:hypothetical protein
LMPTMFLTMLLEHDVWQDDPLPIVDETKIP